jgi:hypothetical protein
MQKMLGAVVLLLVGMVGTDTARLAGEQKESDKPRSSANGKVVGRYLPPPPRGLPAVLLRRPAGQDGWRRLDGGQRDVATGDTLVSFPGYRSGVRFPSGVDLTLWGDLPELSFIYPLLDSVVVVNDPGEFDVDLTLDHGRIVLGNRGGKPARVRVRFANAAARGGMDAWEITLPKKGSEVALELWGRYPAGVSFSTKKNREGPERELYLFVLNGQATVKLDDTTHAMEEPPGAAMIVWDSRDESASSPQRLKRVPSWVGQEYPPLPTGISQENETRLRKMRSDMIKALDELSTQLRGTKVAAALAEAGRSRSPSMRVLALRCQTAINDLSHVLDALVDPDHREVREVAIEELRHWSGLRAENDLVLHDLLIKRKKYTARQADVIMGLLHTFSAGDLARPETFSRLIDYLHQDATAIRELAHWHLVRLVPAGRRIVFDATGDAKSLERAYKAWKELVPEGSLPRLPKKP